MCFREGIGHTTAEDEFVYLTQQVLDDADLGGDFRTTHDRHERTFDIAEDSVHSCYFFLHEEAEHLVVSIEEISDDRGRCVFAVSSTEGIHHIAGRIGSERLCELFLATLHLFLSLFVSRIFFLDIYRFSFLFGIETEVLEQQYLTGFERCGLCLRFCTIRRELNGATESSSYCVYNLAEAVFSRYFAFGFTHMAHNDQGATLIEDVLKSRQGTANTGVVCDLTVLIEWHIEVHAYNRLFAGEFEIFNKHNR